MKRQISLCIARPVGLSHEHPAIGDYLSLLSRQLTLAKLEDGRDAFPNFFHQHTNVHDLPKARNSLCQVALDAGCDYVLFIDPDMEPDMEVIPAGRAGLASTGFGTPNYGEHPAAQQFFWSSLGFLEQLRDGLHKDYPAGSLGIVGAPALSGPPSFMVNVFAPKWPNAIRRVTQREAMNKLAGMEPVAAIGAGIMLIPVEVLSRIERPWFDVTYTSERQDEICHSSDMYFCLNCAQHDVTVWCNWYSWAGHYKEICVGRPNKFLLQSLGLWDGVHEKNSRPAGQPGPEKTNGRHPAGTGRQATEAARANLPPEEAGAIAPESDPGGTERALQLLAQHPGRRQGRRELDGRGDLVGAGERAGGAAAV